MISANTCVLAKICIFLTYERPANTIKQGMQNQFELMLFEPFDA